MIEPLRTAHRRAADRVRRRPRARVVADELAARSAQVIAWSSSTTTGALLHVPAAEQAIAAAAVGSALGAFDDAGGVHRRADHAVLRRVRRPARRRRLVRPIAAANAADVERAAGARPVDDPAGTDADRCGPRWSPACAGGAASDCAARSAHRDASTTTDGPSSRGAPLGVVGFVFEGRPNVFADAAGVVRTGNTVGVPDRLRRARHGTGDRARTPLAPALAAAGLPPGAVSSSTRPRTPPAGRCSPTVAWRSPSPAARDRRLLSSARWRARPDRPSACTAPAGRGSWPAPSRRRPVRRRASSLARPQGVQHGQRLLRRRTGRGRPSWCRVRRAPRSTRRRRASQARLVDSTSTRDRAVVRRRSACLPAGGRHGGPTASTHEPLRQLIAGRRAGRGMGVGALAGGVAVVVVDVRAPRRSVCTTGLSPRFVASLISDDRGGARPLLRRRRRAVRRRRVHALGRRPVRARHARARPVELGARPDPRRGERSCQGTPSTPFATGRRSTTPMIRR